MLQKFSQFILVALMVIAFAFPAAGSDRTAWKKLDRALTYLKAMPEVGWVKYQGHRVLIGWQGLPANFRQINKTAAQKAARALQNEVTVYSLTAEQTGFTGKEGETFLCQTVANPVEIVHSNCR